MDNSSWTRSRKFRLGARLLDDAGGLRIKEARTDPFVVKDHCEECEFTSLSICFLFITLSYFHCCAFVMADESGNIRVIYVDVYNVQQ